MANPVLNRLEGKWEGTGAVQYQPTPFDRTSEDSFLQAQEAYYGPAATPTQMGRMTYDDVIMRTAQGFGVLLTMAVGSWFLSAAFPQLAGGLVLVGFLVGLGLVFANVFSKKVRPGLVIAYAAAEGVALGSLSQVTNAIMPGIVIQAVVGTFAVFGVTLALFASGKVRNSPKLMKFALISIIGLIVTRLVLWGLTLAGIPMTGPNEPTIFGVSLGLLLGLFAVFVGAIALIGDFDQIQRGVRNGAPAKDAWLSAFGLMVTIIWLYVEILNILARTYSSD